MDHEYVQPYLGSRLDEEKFLSLHLKLKSLPMARFVPFVDDRTFVDEETNSAHPIKGKGEFCLFQMKRPNATYVGEEVYF